MKKIWLVIALIIIGGFTAEAVEFDTRMPEHVRRDDVILSLKEIVKLFNEHAGEMGGAGFLYGVKSKIISLFDDSNRDTSHRDFLEKYILRTPEYMLRASGISEDDPDLGGTFVKFCRLMPTTYDTYEICREKILRCVKATYPAESDEFYQNLLAQIYD